MKTITPTTRFTPAVRHFLNIKDRFEQRREAFTKRTFTPAYRIAFRRKETSIKRYKITDIPDMVVHDQNPKWRRRDLVIRRQIGMSVAHIFCGTLDESGKIFGKDHSTVLHAIRCMANAIETRDDRVIPLLVSVFGRFYKQYLTQLNSYHNMTIKQQEQVDTITFKLKKYTFSRMLAGKEVA